MKSVHGMGKKLRPEPSACLFKLQHRLWRTDEPLQLMKAAQMGVAVLKPPVFE